MPTGRCPQIACICHPLKSSPSTTSHTHNARLVVDEYYNDKIRLEKAKIIKPNSWWALVFSKKEKHKIYCPSWDNYQRLWKRYIYLNSNDSQDYEPCSMTIQVLNYNQRPNCLLCIVEACLQILFAQFTRRRIDNWWDFTHSTLL